MGPSAIDTGILSYSQQLSHYFENFSIMETLKGVAAWCDPWGRSGQQAQRCGKINIILIFCPQHVLNY
jgi:hypothetical protein